MSETFTAIETQEQLDKIIKERLDRAEKQFEKKYEGYISPGDFETKTKELNSRIDELSNSLNGANEKATTDAQTIAALVAKAKAYETAAVKSRIAHEVGIPYELANRLSGETEDDIKKDAESMRPFLTPKATPPLRSTESGSAGIATRNKFADWANDNMA